MLYHLKRVLNDVMGLTPAIFVTTFLWRLKTDIATEEFSDTMMLCFSYKWQYVK